MDKISVDYHRPDGTSLSREEFFTPQIGWFVWFTETTPEEFKIKYVVKEIMMVDRRPSSPPFLIVSLELKK